MFCQSLLPKLWTLTNPVKKLILRLTKLQCITQAISRTTLAILTAKDQSVCNKVGLLTYSE